MLTRVAEAKHGTFTYYAEDRFLGTSLRLYGEWSEGEVDFYKDVIKPTDTVVEVGSNIGVLTVPIARICKRVMAFEPQPQNLELLLKNLQDNDINNVTVFTSAVGSENKKVAMPTLDEVDKKQGAVGHYGGPEVGYGSLQVKQVKLDGLLNPNVKIAFMKMDCEGSELGVLKGAEELVKRDNPLLYVENETCFDNVPLVEWLIMHGYRCYWHRPPLFRKDNFSGYRHNIFDDNCCSKNMICVRGHKIDSKWLQDEVK